MSQAVLEPASVRLRDGRGRLYSSLSTDLWCGDDESRAALRAELAAGGLEVLDAPIDAADAVDLDDLSPDGAFTALRSQPAERGDLFAYPAGLVALAAGVAATACYGAVDSGADSQVVPATVLGALCAVLALAVVVLEWVRVRARRRARTLVQPTERAVSAQ